MVGAAHAGLAQVDAAAGGGADGDAAGSALAALAVALSAGVGGLGVVSQNHVCPGKTLTISKP